PGGKPLLPSAAEMAAIGGVCWDLRKKSNILTAPGAWLRTTGRGAALADALWRAGFDFRVSLGKGCALARLAAHGSTARAKLAWWHDVPALSPAVAPVSHQLQQHMPPPVRHSNNLLDLRQHCDSTTLASFYLSSGRRNGISRQSSPTPARSLLLAGGVGASFRCARRDHHPPRS